MTDTTDAYAPSRQTTEGRVYNLTGGDWDEMLAQVAGADPLTEERLVLNMGPQHPSTHGVLRLVLELEGETVTDARVVVGYLHTGIEKNTEYRTWTQAVTFLTRADYLSPFFNETVYSMGVERLLGIEAPPRAQLIRVLMMEINRLSSHWVWLATGGMELGALTAMTNGFRARERCLDIFEMITGLRMNHAYVRPGGIAQDLPDGYDDAIRSWIKEMRTELTGVDKLLTGQTVWINRLKNVGWIGVEGCIALGITGPLLRAAGLPWDLRKTEPYLGYETFDFEVPTDDGGDCWSRFVVRVAEMWESLKIVEQVLDRLEPGPTMVDDPKIAWPAKLSLGPDGLGNSLAHVQKIMNSSMESLIHHFKLVTEGFRVPPGQVYQAVESPRGELGAHIVSDGGTRPYRVHFREPSFINLQGTATMSIGGMVADVIASVASIDPVMGGCDR
ncbi:MAG TPA: NADH-quinone oxidoreductase subunit D [Jatrophihabitantaceae bacterium]|jgi:NADH-quinone oxidoreductase subunit D|nr:NADH-quinone oxidoreductase subunit D [Jatrophihabitantaceae bacterium]